MKNFLVVKYNGSGGLLAGPYIVDEADTEAEANTKADAYAKANPESDGWNAKIAVITLAEYRD